jgi:hypothetical protein
MSLIRLLITGLEFERHDQVPITFAFVAGNLNCGIDVAFEAIHRRPDVFLHLQKLVDTQLQFRTISVLDE